MVLKRFANKIHKKFGLTLMLCFFILNFQNCSKTPLQIQELSSELGSSEPTSGTKSGGDCRIDYTSKAREIRILFLTDTSGSNVDHYRGTDSFAGTDKKKFWRKATLNSFVNKYSTKENFQFGFLHFQDHTAKPLLADVLGKGIFSKKTPLISNTINNVFSSVADNGSTPYEEALNLAEEFIKYDQEQYPSKEVAYVLVMVSDGEPSDKKYQDESDGILNLRNDVNRLVGLLPGQIYVNTVFYYNPDSTLKISNIFLKAMAEEGGGQYMEANSSLDPKIVDTVQIPETVCK